MLVACLPDAAAAAALPANSMRACCLLPCRRQKKLTEYEKWEYKQLMMSGVLDVREYPLFDEENGMGVLAQVDEVRHQSLL